MANNQKKTAALVALADSKTLSEAAGKAGISPRTLYTYIHDDLEFSKAYRDIQEQAKITVMESIAGSVESAIGVIKSIMENEKTPAAVRLRAATSIVSIYESCCSSETYRCGRLRAATSIVSIYENQRSAVADMTSGYISDNSDLCNDFFSFK